MSGKQEFIRLGMFDDVEVSMMAHTIAGSNQAKFSVGGTSNGHVVKHITFTGKSAPRRQLASPRGQRTAGRHDRSERSEHPGARPSGTITTSGSTVS